MARNIAAAAVGIALQTFAVAPAIAAPPTLDALTSCPSDGPNRACVLNSVIVPQPQKCDADWTCPNYPDTAVLDVRGRLANGPLKRHRLRITRDPDQLSSLVAPDLAFLGHSPAGKVIILTAEGPLEIWSKDFRVTTQDKIFVDERTWKRLDLNSSPRRAATSSSRRATTSAFGTPNARCASPA